MFSNCAIFKTPGVHLRFETEFRERLSTIFPNQFMIIRHDETVFLLYHNHTCLIFFNLVFRLMGIKISIQPFSQSVAIQSNQKLEEMDKKLLEQGVKYRNLRRGRIEGMYEVKFDQQDRCIEGCFKLAQLGYKSYCCDYNWR